MLNTLSMSRDTEPIRIASFFSSNIRHIVVAQRSHFGGGGDPSCLFVRLLAARKHKEKQTKSVGRHIVNYGLTGRQKRLHVDWKNRGFQLDCRFILTWHAAGRAEGCDDCRKEEKDNSKLRERGETILSRRSFRRSLSVDYRTPRPVSSMKL